MVLFWPSFETHASTWNLYETSILALTWVGQFQRCDKIIVSWIVSKQVSWQFSCQCQDAGFIKISVWSMSFRGGPRQKHTVPFHSVQQPMWGLTGLPKFWFWHPPKLAVTCGKFSAVLRCRRRIYIYVGQVNAKWIWHLTKISMTNVTFWRFEGLHDVWLPTEWNATVILSKGRARPGQGYFCWPWPWPVEISSYYSEPKLGNFDVFWFILCIL